MLAPSSYAKNIIDLKSHQVYICFYSKVLVCGIPKFVACEMYSGYCVIPRPKFTLWLPNPF